MTEEMPEIGGRSERQHEILTALWVAYLYGAGEFISGKRLGEITGHMDSTHHVAPLRIKLRRMGWDIESNHHGYRLVEWKGERS